MRSIERPGVSNRTWFYRGAVTAALCIFVGVCAKNSPNYHPEDAGEGNGTQTYIDSSRTIDQINWEADERNPVCEAAMRSITDPLSLSPDYGALSANTGN